MINQNIHGCQRAVNLGLKQVWCSMRFDVLPTGIQLCLFIYLKKTNTSAGVAISEFTTKESCTKGVLKKKKKVSL